MGKSFAGSTETYSELCRKSKMEVFAEIIDGSKVLTVAKSSISDVWQDSKSAKNLSFELLLMYF